MNDIYRKVKSLQQVYEERNKMLADVGLEDFAFSQKEIEKYIREAIEKAVVKKINDVAKGL